MATKAILLVVLAAILFTGIVLGDNAQKLPSRKASVVLPLLAKFSPQNNSPQEIMKEVEAILGHADSGEVGGPVGNQWRTYDFTLDDGTQVTVGGWHEYVVRIFVSGHPVNIVYPKPVK